MAIQIRNNLLRMVSKAGGPM